MARGALLAFACGAMIQIPPDRLPSFRAIARILDGSEEDDGGGPPVLPVGVPLVTPRAVAILADPNAPPMTTLPWDLLSEVADAARFLEHIEAYDAAHLEAAGRLCGLDARGMRAAAGREGTRE